MAQSALAEQIAELPYRRAMRPIDLVHLAKQCLGDENLEYEILRLFDTTVQTYFGRLQQALTFDEFAMNLHSIKGAASGVGAFTVSNLAKGCETELQAGRPLNPERIADLGMAIEEVRTFISRMLSNEPA
ncbi:Hpt domain-containing protein [Devosia sp. SL43]|uniref:Hpt domain-containing protein n=1 Tax=Devosia sp. SL43 TaxID=2806348 RepID=UPI001F28FFBA|nr:Hpt domain-containing protein [Devosia sp. SL43]UJW86667.1 Hpt domain-containing protein [Devosia sp. SL43]